MSDFESDPLGVAMQEAGIDPDKILAVRRRLRDEGYYLTENYVLRRNREKAEAAARRAAQAAAAIDAAAPYKGEIVRCQASVSQPGRGILFYRCQKNARFVVRLNQDPHGDGRMAVCRTHVRGATRYLKHWDYEVSADEPVEPEYQP